MSSALRKPKGEHKGFLSEHAGELNYYCQPLKHVSL